MNKVPQSDINSDVDVMINHYLDHLRTQRKFSAHTIKSYQRDLIQLASLADKTKLAELSHHQIRRIVSKLHAQNMSPRSIGRKLSAWRGFYQWLANHYHLQSNPLEGIKAPRRAQSLPKALSVDDSVRLVATPSAKKAPSQQESAVSTCNRAMFELLYSSGLRVSELTGLDIRPIQQADYVSQGWVNLDEQEVIVTGKGNKKRVVPVGKAAVDAIHNWLIERDKLSIQPEKSHQFGLFLNQSGRRITARTIQLRLKAHAQLLGMPLHVHPHVLRHSFASHVLQSSGDLRAVQEMLGHASIASTQVYTALDFQHLAKIYDAAHPRAKTK